jgi:hypothetical protein
MPPKPPAARLRSCAEREFFAVARSSFSSGTDSGRCGREAATGAGREEAAVLRAWIGLLPLGEEEEEEEEDMVAVLYVLLKMKVVKEGDSWFSSLVVLDRGHELFQACLFPARDCGAVPVPVPRERGLELFSVRFLVLQLQLIASIVYYPS